MEQAVARYSLLVPLAVACGVAPALLSAQAAIPVGRWNANIRPMLAPSSGIGSATMRMYGSVTVTANRAGNPGSWVVEIRLTSDRPSETLLWAIAPGRCQSGAVAQIQANQLPPLEVTANGTAEISTAANLILSPGDSYHLDIFRNGQQQENVVACATLKYSDKNK